MADQDSGYQEPDKKNPLLSQFEDDIAVYTRGMDRIYSDVNLSRNYAQGWRNGVKQETAVGSDGLIQFAREGKVQTNIVQSTIAGMLPHIYATNPSIAVRPGMHVDYMHPYSQLANGFSKTAEVVLDAEFKAAKLKDRMKRLVRSIQTSKVGWLKITYQRDIYRDPMIQNRINDIQDNLQKLQRLMSSMRQDGDLEAEELKAEEMKNQIASLRQQVEVVRSEGLAIDNIAMEKMLVHPCIEDMQDYMNSPWLGHFEYYTPEKVMEMFKLTKEQIENYTFYARDARRKIIENNTFNEAAPVGERKNWTGSLIKVYEIWNHDDNMVYTWCCGSKTWCREPYSPQRQGERWYPFFLMGHNWLDGSYYPESDAEQLMELQNEHELIREQQQNHRYLSKPFWITDAEQTDENSIERFSDSEIGEIVKVAAGGRNLDQVFQAAQPPAYNPQIYDTSPINFDVQLVSGLGEAQRNSINRAKTATEASMLEQAFASRIEERQDTTEDFLQEIAEYVLQVLLQEIPPEVIQQKYGQKAVWPSHMARRELYNLIDVEIRAGSTGRPNQARDVQQWSQLLPEVEKVMQLALQMQMQMGIPVEANPFVNVLRETFRRMDERLDVMQFLGPLFGQMQQQAQAAVQNPNGAAVQQLAAGMFGGAPAAGPAGGSTPQPTQGTGLDSGGQTFSTPTAPSSPELN